MIPYYSFEQFVHKVEEVGASNRVRINFFLPLRVCFHSVGQQDLSPTMRDGPSEISYQHHTAPASKRCSMTGVLEEVVEQRVFLAFWMYRVYGMLFFRYCKEHGPPYGRRRCHPCLSLSLACCWHFLFLALQRP